MKCPECGEELLRVFDRLEIYGEYQTRHRWTEFCKNCHYEKQVAKYYNWSGELVREDESIPIGD